MIAAPAREWSAEGGIGLLMSSPISTAKVVPFRWNSIAGLIVNT